MALGSVSVNNLNLGQGEIDEIERLFLFIGPATKNTGKLVALNTQSDLDAELGVAASDLKTQLTAARLNGGERWSCWAAPQTADGSWLQALEQAQQSGVRVEAVVICKPVASGDELLAMHAAAVEQGNRYGRRLFIMAATAGIQAGQSWPDYLAAQRAITADVLAPRVLVVPQVHGNDLGVLAGRLANAAVSIADSPMRVATGPLVGLGEGPKDKDGLPLEMATLAALDRARFSVPQTYPDYPGWFWGDANLLAAPADDYQVLEHLRVVDKAARQIRVLLIQRVADRRLNNTPNSMAANTSALMAPLRAMARAMQFNGVQFPGEIQPPRDGDVVLRWLSKTKVEAYIVCRPHNCPKTLIANIALDLSSGED